jgi:hypothetical protein
MMIIQEYLPDLSKKYFGESVCFFCLNPESTIINAASFLAYAAEKVSIVPRAADNLSISNPLHFFIMNFILFS